MVETHLHADFVSGHRELAERTGAEVVFGARAAVSFPHRAVKDGEELQVGRVTLRFLETPGHTPESLSVVVSDQDAAGGASDTPALVLTGDTLFIGDVGRPDLAGSSGFSAEQMASMLYDSLHDKLLRLPDATEVYPAHGAGSLCGRNISKETSSTIGHERQHQLRAAADVEAGVRQARDRRAARAAAVLREGRGDQPRGGAVAPGPPAARVAHARRARRARARGSAGRGRALGRRLRRRAHPRLLEHRPRRPVRVLGGSLLDAQREILIVAEDEGAVAEAALRLARVGLENVKGYLAGGTLAWFKAGQELATLAQWPVDELGAQLATGGTRPRVLDVRRPGEYAGGHVPGAVNLPLDRLAQDAAGLDRSRPIAIICASGYRSSVAGSLLQQQGFAGELYNVVGGTSAWIAAGLPTEGS